MALSRLFKLNNLKHLADTRYAAGMGVSYLGCAMDDNSVESQAYLSHLQELTGWVAGPQIIIEDQGLSLAGLQKAVELIHVDGLESHNLELLADSGLLSIWKVDWSRTQDLNSIYQASNSLLLTGNLAAIHLLISSEQELDFIADLRATVKPQGLNVLVNLPFTHLNFIDLLPITEINGFAMESGEEERPGFKDLTELMDVLELLEVED